MDARLPLWKYYEKGFIDPLYQPYQRRLELGRMQSTGRAVGVEVNPYTTAGDPMYVHPELERKGWGLSFQRQFTYDACPAGWTPGEDGWCFQTEPEQDALGLFYTDQAYIVKDRYWNAYAEPATGYQPLNEFDNRSVSIYDGLFDTTHRSYVDPETVAHDRLPAQDCYV